MAINGDINKHLLLHKNILFSFVSQTYPRYIFKMSLLFELDTSFTKFEGFTKVSLLSGTQIMLVYDSVILR